MEVDAEEGRGIDVKKELEEGGRWRMKRRRERNMRRKVLTESQPVPSVVPPQHHLLPRLHQQHQLLFDLTRTHARTHTHAQKQPHTNTHKRTYIHTRACTRTHRHKYINVIKHTHTHT